MKEKLNALALAAFIVGLISLALPFFGILTGVVAVVLGIIALREKENSKQDRVFSIVGIVTGILPIFIVILGILFFSVRTVEVTVEPVSMQPVTSQTE